MSEHHAEVVWRRDGAEFGTGYNRNHQWRFDGGVVIAASAAPGLFGDPTRVDPEEAFVASISSCHMLWFLYLAGDQGLVVDRYADAAVGTMAKGDDGRVCITHVDLRPAITWSGDPPPDNDIAALHRQPPTLLHRQLRTHDHHCQPTLRAGRRIGELVAARASPKGAHRS